MTIGYATFLSQNAIRRRRSLGMIAHTPPPLRGKEMSDEC
jgi:hypothetical protein